MNHVLFDIKKVLKKLKNGQLEIEAGQWELHKDINKLKKTIKEFKRLQRDVYFMKKHGLKQMDLIKQLQTNFNGSVTEKINNSSLTTNCDGKERNISLPKEQVTKTKNEKKILKNTQSVQKSSSNSQSYKKLRFQEVQETSKTPSFDRAILQRYLHDSVKYMTKETAENGISNNWLSLKPVLQTVKPGSWNDCDSSWTNIEKRSTASTEKKESSILKKNGKRRYKKTKSLQSCKVCEKNFFCKNHLKKHNKIHEKMTQCFKGFKCSYCDEICRSPETLTEHLRKCRIITKTQNKVL